MAIGVGVLAVLGVVTFAFCDRPNGEGAVSAQGLVTHTPEEAWPPPAAEMDVALTATALRQIWEPALHDGGADAGEVDAGPPIVVPAEQEGLRARHDVFEGIHYLEAVIGDAAFEDPLPTVFVFHGRGGQAQLPGGPFLGLSRPVRVIIPQAPDRLGKGWEWVPVSVGSGLVDRLSSSLFEVSGRVARMMRAVIAERPTVGRPIVSGFSQGGLLTYALALHHDDVVGYALPLSTWLPPPLEPLYKREDLRFPPMRSMHGVEDRIIPIGPTRALVERLTGRGFEVELVEFEGVGHEMSEEMNALYQVWLERALCTVTGDVECAALAEEALEDGAVPLNDGGVLEDGAAPGSEDAG